MFSKAPVLTQGARLCISGGALALWFALGTLGLGLQVGLAQAQVASAPPAAASASAQTGSGAANTVSGPGLAGVAPAALGQPGGANPAPDPARLQVASPFIELRTGPGRGYPVFHSAERGAWIRIELRRTDWYRVRVEGQSNAPVGWVSRQQLESTLVDAGAGRTFRDGVLDDYVAKRLQAGFAYGRLQGQPLIAVWTQARLSDTLAAELRFGQAQGRFAGTDFWHLDLVAEPWAHWRFSPFFSVGLGRMNNAPNASLIAPQTSHAKMAHARMGLTTRLSERMQLRLDWSLYASFLSESRTVQNHAGSLGLAFHF